MKERRVQFSDIMNERIEDWKKAAYAFGPLLMGEKLTEPLADIRERYNQELGRNLPPDDVVFTDVDMGRIPAQLATPSILKSGRKMIYIHGGGYYSGGPSGYRGIAGHYAKMLAAEVYIPDYRLAPEHPLPAGIDDSLAAYKWLADQTGDTREIVFAGESAGGAMVVSVMVKARDAGIALPAGGVAISPWADLEMTSSSYLTRDGIDIACNRDFLVKISRIALSGQMRPNEPEVSPVHADVRGLPPILIQIGEAEVMLSDAMKLATHLAENRVRASLEVWPGMFHGWPMFAGLLPEGMQALETGSFFLDRCYNEGERK